MFLLPLSQIEISFSKIMIIWIVSPYEHHSWHFLSIFELHNTIVFLVCVSFVFSKPRRRLLILPRMLHHEQ
jgi:hypothetical protein